MQSAVRPWNLESQGGRLQVTFAAGEGSREARSCGLLRQVVVVLPQILRLKWPWAIFFHPLFAGSPRGTLPGTKTKNLLDDVLAPLPPRTLPFTLPEAGPPSPG